MPPPPPPPPVEELESLHGKPSLGEFAETVPGPDEESGDVASYDQQPVTRVKRQGAGQVTGGKGGVDDHTIGDPAVDPPCRAAVRRPEDRQPLAAALAEQSVGQILDRCDVVCGFVRIEFFGQAGFGLAKESLHPGDHGGVDLQIRRRGDQHRHHRIADLVLQQSEFCRSQIIEDERGRGSDPIGYEGDDVRVGVWTPVRK